MGGANNICSDKTGTLTMNKMTLTNIMGTVHWKKFDIHNKDLKNSRFNKKWRIFVTVQNINLCKWDCSVETTEEKRFSHWNCYS